MMLLQIKVCYSMNRILHYRIYVLTLSRFIGHEYLSNFGSSFIYNVHGGELSYSAAVRRGLLSVAFSVGSVFVFICSSITRQVSITTMQESLRSSDREVSEGVSFLSSSAAVTKFLTD
jgi:hypothetical protein